MENLKKTIPLPSLEFNDIEKGYIIMGLQELRKSNSVKDNDYVLLKLLRKLQNGVETNNG